ncbi:unnamed protein product [Bursaphelenchus xylophilus]|uniref:(pine wood nematode) hypothetical protein n=1 Tax=Bursaphelenchus xylophilus TaxID=6326 RepID=A0A1I7RMN3_BURXY|nr:unnamed protein product [Bursaphelenchus xylophilus]CAG9125646.1 unnamed protein product [Bursaphelenchus xylophilus]
MKLPEMQTQSTIGVNVAAGGVQQRKPKSRKPTRQALQRHIALLQTKRRHQDNLPLLKRVLIQEEFEDKIFRLNNTSDESSDEDEPSTSANSSPSTSSASSSASSSSSSDSESDEEDCTPRYTLVKRSRFTIMSSRKKSKKGN